MAEAGTAAQDQNRSSDTQDDATRALYEKGSGHYESGSAQPADDAFDGAEIHLHRWILSVQIRRARRRIGSEAAYLFGRRARTSRSTP